MKKHFIWGLVLFAVFMFCSESVFADKSKIFIANSYNQKTFRDAQKQNDGFIKRMSDLGYELDKDYELIIDTMDAFKNRTHESREKEAKRILGRIEEIKPDVILTTDDDALNYIGLQIHDIPVVFSGINKPMISYISYDQIDNLSRPGHNITGVYQQCYYLETLNLMQRFNPDAKNMAVITDKSTTGFAILEQMHYMRDMFPFKWTDTLGSDSFAEWKDKINEWQDTIDLIVIITPNQVMDEKGNTLAPLEITKWIAYNNKALDTSFWKITIAGGILASSVDYMPFQGMFQAEAVDKILQGTPPGDIPIVTPPRGSLTINAWRAKKNGFGYTF